MVHLEELNKYNVWDIMDLSVKKEQEGFLASNVWSLVHAYVGNKTNGAVYPFGIYDDDTPVGFLMLAYDYGEVCDDKDAPIISKDNYFLWRLMIDKKYQGKGLGKQTMDAAMDLIRTFLFGEEKKVWLSYEPENTRARDIYQKYGFVENEEMCGNEIVAVYEL